MKDKWEVEPGWASETSKFQNSDTLTNEATSPNPLQIVPLAGDQHSKV